MSLAPKFKQWVDDLQSINGIYTTFTGKAIIVYITNDHAAYVERTKYEPIKIFENGEAELVITDIKTTALDVRCSGDNSVRIPLDDKHLEYLNIKLKSIIASRTVDYWEDLHRRTSKVMKDIKEKEEIDKFF